MASSPAPPEGLSERELEPGVLRWLIDKPARRNAIGPAIFEWIRQRCSALAGEVVILRGAGERAFTAGFDLKALAEYTDLAERGRLGRSEPPDDALIRATSAMQAADATFIAALNGYVIGAGVELISSCDLRVACTAATLRLPAGKLGVVYHAAGLARIHAAFGPAIARRLLLAGEQVPIADARASLAALVDYAELDEQALVLARRVREQSPRSVAGNRAILRALDRALPLSAELLEAHEQLRRDAYRDMSS